MPTDIQDSADAHGPLPDRIGSFRVLELLGHGGMGSVYLAEQDAPLERRVALKLIRGGSFEPRILARFEAEGRALGRMSHPNIAQVYEAGSTPEGLPYIAMEPAPGLPITVYCDEHRVPLEGRLGLFLSVCEGVQHAHQKALLHRDLKPSNILVTEVDGRPIPKIIDFGVAKALDQTGESTVSVGWGLVGTPFYLSPEALEHPAGGPDADVRADVYALGVVLFELLAGSHPFLGGGTSGLVRRILDGDFPRPSEAAAAGDREACRERAARRGLEPTALARALRGELDWIALRAMARERSRRYGSPGELAADLRRHLRHEAVAAGPPGRAYRARKFVRRHRTAVAAAGIGILTLAGGFVARSLEVERANRASARAQREAEAAQQVSQFLQSLFEESAPGSRRPSEISARELLDRGAARIREELRDQPLVRARLLNTIGRVYLTLDLYDAATPLLEEALATRTDHLDADSHPDVAESLHTLGELHVRRGGYEEAIPYFERAIGIRRSLEDRVSLATSLMQLATAQGFLDRSDEAERLFLEALGIREEALGPEHEDVAATLNNLANLYHHEERLEDAERAHLRSIAIKEKALGPGHVFLAQSLNNLANIYLSQDRLDEAEALHRRALGIKQRALEPGHMEIGVSHHNLGDIAIERGDVDAALERYLEAKAIFEARLPPEHPFLGYSAFALGRVHAARDDVEAARRSYRRSLEIRLASHPADHPLVREAREALEALDGAGLSRDGAPP